MTVKIKERWYKTSKRGRDLMHYKARGYDTKDGKGKGKKAKDGFVTNATIWKDPILKRYPNYAKAIKKHEVVEIKARSRGMTVNQAHHLACSKEPKLIKRLNLKQLWDKMK